MDRFVVGSGRCGSTLLSLMLGRHPRVLNLSEFFNGLDMDRRFATDPVSGKAFAELIGVEQGVVTAVVRGSVPGPKLKLDPLPETRRRWKAGRYLRSRFGGGDVVVGPSIVSEDNATTYIPKGWSAKVESDGRLRISK